MFTPWVALAESCDWQCHINAHNTDLGDDFPMTAGTPIPAPFDGTVTHQIRPEPAPYKALYIVYIQSDDDPSLVFEFMHASRFVPDGHYRMTETIMYSGGTRFALGSGRASGPHLHANARVNGVLTPVRDAISGFASVGPVTPIGIGEIGMDKFLINRTGPSINGLYVFDYSTKAYRPVTTKGENFILAAEKSAGRVAQYDVNDATMAADYGDWKLWVAPTPNVATVDMTAISAAVTAAVTSALAKFSVKIDDAAIAQAVDDAVADNFAAIPGAVVKAQGAALSNG